MIKKIIKASCFLVLIVFVQFAKAQMPIGGVSGTLTVKNSYIYNDPSYSEIGTSVSINNSVVRGLSSPSSNGNIAVSSALNYKDNAAVINGTAYYLSPTSTLVNAGANDSSLPSKDINGNDRTYDSTVDIGAVEYSLIYEKGTKNWNTASHWNIGRIPNQNDVVTIKSDCDVTTANAICKKIIAIESGKKLTIAANQKLVVTDKIQNADPTRIVVKSSDNDADANGTLIFHNSDQEPVSATVEMYSKAYTDNSKSASNDKYIWQYFGIPVKSVAASPTFSNSWVRIYNESKPTSTVGLQWDFLGNTSVMKAFQGYEITQPEARKFNIQGQLVNCNLDTTLKVTSGSYYKGQHVLSNPYTAAIRISDIELGDGMEQTIYIYNTGSFSNWQTAVSNPDNSIPGHYLAIPKNQTNYIMPSISSMQGFVVKVAPSSTSGKLKINYSSVADKNNFAQRVNSENNLNEEKIYSIVDVRSEHYVDRMWLFTDANCTSNFDNGWDGPKMLTSGAAAQLFAAESDGNYQVNSKADINDTYLGFKAGQEDTNYTLYFKHMNIADRYKNLSLLDLQTGSVTDITADESQYNFVATNVESTQNRFKIISIAKDEIENENNGISSFLEGNTIFINNYNNTNGQVYIYDMSGRMILQKALGAKAVTALTLPTYQAMYIAKVSCGENETTKKYIIN